MAYVLIRIPDLIGYQEALDLQMALFDKVEDHTIDGALLILEHKPVLTMGIRTDDNNLLVSKEYLADHGVELYRTDRGGDITFHGPGQIVAYPILRFRDFGLRLSDYMHLLEQVVIDTLKEHDVIGYAKEEFPGVWVDDTKICAIGVRAKKYITYHGLAFNITTNKNYFQLINPCGITEYAVSTLSDFINEPNIEEIKTTLVQAFENRLNVSFDTIEIQDIKSL